MNREIAYVTSIPEEAKEKVTAKQDGGTKKRAEYYIDGELVGIREFFPAGEVDYEVAFKNGVKHGTDYRWYAPDQLLSREPYENGVPHGTAYEWGRNGTLLGTYTLEHGTGIDLWWEDWADGSENLAEVYYMRDGARHGFEWWLHADETRVWHERHWHKGIEHGIERRWNSQDRLRRGYPRYWVNGERVTKAKYLREAARDPTLPLFQAEDNAPQRTFPPEIARHLRHSSQT
jgi:antitoxin component YwqK of YwqJK toxin-antitoxin module